jgi:hypothetical protein
MNITLPKGYELPDGAQMGEPFEAVATLIANEDGTFTLDAIDGMDIEGETEEEEEETESPEARLAASVKLPWSGEEEEMA